jgi:cyclopropane-fatty-acyl-phospholipid synthase
MLFAHFLNKIIRCGTLEVIDATGRKHIFTGTEWPRCAVRLHDRALHRSLILHPQLGLGEAYMDGRLTIEEGTIHDFLDLCGRNFAVLGEHPIQRFKNRLSTALRRIQQFNPVGIAQRNVAHHYDLSGKLYDLFLDEDRQYSCAYFANGNESLEVAQENKKRHLAAKLLLEPGQKVLDIGSGWGGLGLYLARTTGADVTGITLSTEQHKVSQERTLKAGLSDRVRFRLQDYRLVPGTFDRIVSVGMFEHVGVRHYGEFFAKVEELLTNDGICVLHSIGHMERPCATNPWLRKYIFPGGYTPAMSEMLAAVEKSGLTVTDVEILRLHYAETLKEWYRRFTANRNQVKELYDERFCRMWEFYLAGSEASFRHMGHMVVQMQLAKRQDAAPLTRDYITDWERAHNGLFGSAG